MDYSKGTRALSKKGFYFGICPLKQDRPSSLVALLKSISPPTVRQNYMAVFGPVLCGEQLGIKMTTLPPEALIGPQTSQAWQGVGDVLGLGQTPSNARKTSPKARQTPAKLGRFVRLAKPTEAKWSF